MSVTESFRKRFSKLYDLLKERLIDGRIDVMSHHSIIIISLIEITSPFITLP